MIIVLLIFGVFLWVAFFGLSNLYDWQKRQKGKIRQRKLEADNKEPLLGFEKCSPQFQAYMREEIKAGRVKAKTEPQGEFKDATYDPDSNIHYGERGGRYRYRYNKRGEAYRDYF